MKTKRTKVYFANIIMKEYFRINKKSNIFALCMEWYSTGSYLKYFTKRKNAQFLDSLISGSWCLEKCFISNEFQKPKAYNK